jgi:hypothetical protein
VRLNARPRAASVRREPDDDLNFAPLNGAVNPVDGQLYDGLPDLGNDRETD